MVRTNPVTGWKGITAIGYTMINGAVDEVTDYEDHMLKEYSK